MRPVCRRHPIGTARNGKHRSVDWTGAVSVAWVIRPALHGDGTLHHGADALPHEPGGLRLPMPDGGEDFQRLGAGQALVDFDKLRKKGKKPAIIEPREIFRRLPKPDGINDLYASQLEVLDAWFRRRTDRDVVIN